MEKEKLGAYIAARRKETGLTQKELAAALHVTDKAVSKWERAISYPDITLIEPLAAALGVSVERLMTCGGAEEDGGADALLQVSKASLGRAKLWSFCKGVVWPMVLLAMALFAAVTGFRRSAEEAKLYFAPPAVLAQRTEEGGGSGLVSVDRYGISARKSRLCGCEELGTLNLMDGTLTVETASKRGDVKLLLLNEENDAAYCAELPEGETALQLVPGSYRVVLVGYWYTGRVAVDTGGLVI